MPNSPTIPDERDTDNGTPVRRILFVCTGNSCRSPMAEALFRARLAGRAGWEADSAGLFAARGMSASEGAIAALEELGMDLRAHRSKPVTPGAVAAADWIIPMTRHHRDQLLRAYPEAASRLRLLLAFQPDAPSPDVPDPVGHDLFVYRRIRDRIDSALADLILTLLSPPDSHGEQTS